MYAGIFFIGGFGFLILVNFPNFRFIRMKKFFGFRFIRMKKFFGVGGGEQNSFLKKIFKKS